ncbi:Plasma membrane fusion protein [Citrus sinensis]|nr:Plasma membrane fusion protein [Citrus sinensis]
MMVLIFSVGCIVLYTGQGKFHSSTLDTLNYVVKQAHITSESLQNVSDYLAAAKTIGVNSVTLAPDVQSNIDKIDRKINSSATTLSYQTKKNSKDIKDALDSVGLALIIVAAVMLFLAFLGFLFSVFGLQCLVYFVVADTCVSMDEWVKNPTAHTALDDILPCVDNATAQETLKQTKTVTNQLVSVVDRIIINVVNRNFLPQAGIVYYNQSGPLLPVLCNPFNSDLTNRQCVASEVDFSNATELWKNYICQPSSSGICKTPGRLTPTLHNQMASAVNVSYALYRYGPFLVNLQDCTFVRDTFTDISRDHCPGLQRHSKWIYIGLFMVSAAVMLSLIFWVIYARERRHRVYTKNLMD